jgi:hypothetical protein
LEKEKLPCKKPTQQSKNTDAHSAQMTARSAKTANPKSLKAQPCSIFPMAARALTEHIAATRVRYAC